MAATAAAAVVASRNTSIEFIVKPKEDLYLEGTLRRLPRVTKGEPYPCQMQKTQTFSCLFRHYAKHNGLRKEDLIFTFVDELQNDQTPETVHLMPQDEIWVEHRYPAEVELKAEPEVQFYSDQFRGLLESGSLTDVEFLVGEGSSSPLSITSSSPSSSNNASECELIRAHRAILSARSEYFHAMFREGGMLESRSSGEPIRIPSTDAATFRRMLEFLYTNTVRDLTHCGASELMALLTLANEYLLQTLRELCEKHAAKLVSISTVGRFLQLSCSSSEGNTALEIACRHFVKENCALLAEDPAFKAEVESCGEIGWRLFTLWSDRNNSSISSEGSNFQEARGRGDKRRRITAESSSSENEMLDHVVSSRGPNTIAQSNANVQDF